MIHHAFPRSVRTLALAGGLCFLFAASIHAAAATPAGLVLDDDAAEYKGTWVTSEKQAPIFGTSYRHDDNKHQGEASAVFTPKITEPGDYEVRLLYVATKNRATNVPVTIQSADGAKTITINQREEALQNGVPRALGVFRFEAGSKASLEITNKDTDGYVVVDGVQFVPVALAKSERDGKASSGFTSSTPTEKKSHVPASTRSKEVESSPEHTAARARLAATAALSPLAEKTAERKTGITPDTAPIALAKDVPAAQVNGKSYDLIVVGATAGGTACAVRAAREGLTVLLVQHNRHIGGMMSNGLMQWDALYGGPRAPLFTELLGNIEKYYIERFGKDSPDHQIIRYSHQKYPIGWAESKVNEREFNRLVAGEKNLTLLLSHYPVSLEREGAIIKGVTLREYGTKNDITAKATVFADGTYEGDLFALAKVPFRVGREARAEYNEPHAGKAFVNIDGDSAPVDAIEGKLNIRPYGSRQGTVDPTSPFTADGAVQAYNYRFCVTKDPANRLMLSEPPPGYNREEYVNYGRKSIATNAGPNLKSHMNSPILPGENHAYPEADWPTREKIIERHKNFGLGLIWFLQNDESVSEKARAGFREWGLPKDEFTDNGHIPYEMYVREARRIVGRHVLTELDGFAAKGYARTPIQHDSIGTTDWYQDSHSCTTDSRPGFKYDGKLILTEESRPTQIPYRSLLPQGVDNLLVPICLSATHVMWGAIRLEPVWMQTGEAAGFAAAQAIKDKTTPAALDSRKLVRTLAERQFLVSFFNDVKVTNEEAWIPAVQYLATQGFFEDYDARASARLDMLTGKLWVEALAKLVEDQGQNRNGASGNSSNIARQLATSLTQAAAIRDAADMKTQDFLQLVRSVKGVNEDAVRDATKRIDTKSETITRGDACLVIYTLLKGGKN
jgi:hypothetical protein